MANTWGKNCTMCKFSETVFCLNPVSQYYNPKKVYDPELLINEYTICKELEEKNASGVNNGN